MNRLKNILSLFWYGVKLGEINLLSLIINTILFIYAALDIEEILQKDFLLLLLLLFTNIVWQGISLFGAIYRLFHSTGHYLDKIHQTCELELPANQKYVRYQNPNIGVDIIYSITTNAIIKGDKEISLSKSRSSKRYVDAYIRQNKGILLLFLKAKWKAKMDGAFFNESKLCQATEISENAKGASVWLRKGCYYDSFVTNEIYCCQLNHQSGITLYSPLNVTNAPIKALDNSYFGNHIGVSVIAVTTDGEMIILRHNNSSAICSNMYAPSASGSVDYGDWHQNSDTDFRQIVIRAMHREFEEETKISKEYIDRTEIIGTYRNLMRGGKPEYCGVTYLNVDGKTAQELFKPEKKEVQDRMERIVLFDGTIQAGHLKIEEYRRFEARHEKNISPSLHMNMYFLEKFFTIE
ncbi:MAG: hypothetical protein IKA49_04165 [Alistipes sp.]|nr:hypothetical protein [Alistipes sp.]